MSMNMSMSTLYGVLYWPGLSPEDFSSANTDKVHQLLSREGYGVQKIDPIGPRAGCSEMRLNQALCLSSVDPGLVLSVFLRLSLRPVFSDYKSVHRVGLTTVGRIQGRPKNRGQFVLRLVISEILIRTASNLAAIKVILFLTLIRNLFKSTLENKVAPSSEWQ